MNKIKRWFWAPVHKNENVAQTTFRVLGSFLRMGIAAVMVLLLLLVLRGWHDSYKTRNQPFNKLALQIEYNIADCSKAKPLRITVKNQSKKTLTYLDFDLSATKPGRSTNLLEHGNTIRQWDFIVPPRITKYACYANPYGTDYRPLSEWSDKELIDSIEPLTKQATQSATDEKPSGKPWENDPIVGQDTVTATNPDTGATVQLIDGAWVSVVSSPQSLNWSVVLEKHTAKFE